MSSQFIGDELERTANHYPDQVALQVQHGPQSIRYTYRDTQRLARNLSWSLNQRGIRKGDCAAIWAPTSPEWAIVYLGLLYSGVIAVSLDVEFRSEEVSSALIETGCKLVFITGNKSAELLTIIKDLPGILTLTLDESSEPDGTVPLGELLEERDCSFQAPCISGKDIATIIYTSGTTGMPKGVIISHQAVTATILGMFQFLDLGPKDNVLAVVPSHHVFAPIGSLLVPLVAGATITYMAGIKSTDLLAAFQQQKITVFPCVPQVFYLFHKKIFEEVRRKPLLVRLAFECTRRLSYGLRRLVGVNCGRIFFAKLHKSFGGRLRLLISGGSSFDPRIIRDLYSFGFTVKQGYGLTESFGGGTLSPSQRDVLGSVGIPLPDLQVSIMNPDDEGIGEIVIGGPTLMHAYLNDPALTSEVLRDGWLYTGDLGYRDDRGHFYITGRKKDVIVLSSGKKIFPEELEELYLQSPVIKEICALGISSGNGVVPGEQLHAVVVPDFDYLREASVVNSRQVVREEIERISANLPEHKRILSYDVQATPLPRTATRKIMRWVVRESFKPQARGEQFWRNKAGKADADILLSQTETSREILKVIRRESGVTVPLHPEMNLELDLGFDSLQRIELFAALEQLFNIRLDEGTAARCFTLQDVIREVEQSRNRRSEVRALDDIQISWKDILRSPENDPLAETDVLKQRPVIGLINFVLLKFVFLLAKLLFSLEVHGKENLPSNGPYLICPNHEGYLDGVLLACTFPHSVIRKLFTVGWSEFFTGSRFKEMLAFLVGTVPINPDTKLLSAMKVSAAGLRAGKILLMFPEGGLTMDGKLLSFRKGPAILSRELQAPIVPVAISGSFQVWPKGGSRIRLAPVKITISKPLPPHIPTESESNEDYARITQEVKDRISHLLAVP